MKKIRAKFLCNSVLDFGEQKQASLMAVTGKEGENSDYAKYTPAGNLNITVDKEAAIDFFKPGKEYYLDFTVAE